MGALLRRLWFIATGRRQELELADEIAFHRAMKEQELRDRGVSETEIASRAQRALGNDLSARHQSRDVWVWPWLQDISQDVRFGVRMLAKDRRFTIAAVLALGLGIGVNNSMFTIVELVMFRDLPFVEPHRLVEPQLVDARENRQVSYADFLAWSASARSFAGLAATAHGTINLSDDAHPAERLRGGFLSASVLDLLGVRPILGRGFMAEDERPGAPPVTIVGYEVWQGRYGGDPSVVGQTVRVNGVPATLIGVMPPGFSFPMALAWQPITAVAGLSETNRRQRNLSVVGRLGAGVSLEQARAELQTLAGQIAQAYPETNKDLRAAVVTLRDATVRARGDGAILATLMGAVGFVLLIACANVASLLLARSAHRAREMAIRASLGATRWRIIRQLLIECGIIAVLAGLLGTWLSIFGAREIAQAFNVFEIGAPGATTKPYWVDPSMSTVTLMFVGAACLFTSLAIGVVPSWHLSRTNVNDVLKDGGRTGSATVRARRMTGGLLIAELALTVVLLASAGLFIRAYFSLYYTDLVLDTRGVVTMRVSLPAQKYATRDHQQQFVDALYQRLGGQPMFSSAGLGSDIPIHPLGFASGALAIHGRTPVAGEEPPNVFRVMAGPGYFETLGMPIVRGRGLTDMDGLAGREGALVNERFAAKFFANGDAIGQRIQLTPPGPAPQPSPWLTIVGITPSLPNFLPDRQEEAVAYLPMRADPAQLRAVSIVVRTADRSGAAKAVAAATLREQVTAIDADLPVFGIQTLDEAAAVARGPTRLIGSWFITIALVALILAGVGLYALTAHSVAQRAPEIGVRMALGAQSGQVVWLFVRRTLFQLALGLTIGIAGALALGRLLSLLLRGTDPHDPVTLIVVSALLVMVAVAASIWPARKAARVDPVVALRAD